MHNKYVQVKTEGFDLLSKESVYMKDKQSAAEGDAWVISFAQAEALLMQVGCRRRCLSILKTLRDRHLELPGVYEGCDKSSVIIRTDNI